jgi:hypothetical protein
MNGHGRDRADPVGFLHAAAGCPGIAEPGHCCARCTLKPKGTVRVRTPAMVLVGALTAAAVVQAGTYEAPLDVREDGDVRFVSAPRAEAAGGKVRI